MQIKEYKNDSSKERSAKQEVIHKNSAFKETQKRMLRLS